MKRKKITTADLRKMREMKAAEYQIKQIAAAIGCSEPTVWRHLNNYSRARKAA